MRPTHLTFSELPIISVVMKRSSLRILRTLLLATLFLVIGASAFARHKFDKEFSWLSAWQSLFGTDGWTKAVRATATKGMTPEEVTARLGDADHTWTSGQFADIFERFSDYDSVWFYETPYPVEAILRPDGGENLPMNGAWIGFQNGVLTFCSPTSPGQ